MGGPWSRALNAKYEDVGAWVRFLGNGKVSDYEATVCRLFKSVSEIKTKYAWKPADFFKIVGVKDKQLQLAFGHGLKALRKQLGIFNYLQANAREVDAQRRMHKISKPS